MRNGINADTGAMITSGKVLTDKQGALTGAVDKLGAALAAAEPFWRGDGEAATQIAAQYQPVRDGTLAHARQVAKGVGDAGLGVTTTAEQLIAAESAISGMFR
jgi:hypothetical protein